MVKSFVGAVRRLGLTALVGAPFILGAATAQASLITNGSFETHAAGGYIIGNTQVPGWGVTGTVDVVTTGYWQVADGFASLDMNGTTGGGVWQSFATQIGAVYKVAFMMAGNPDQSFDKSMRVSVADVVKDYVFSQAGKTKANMGWTEKEFLFTAQAATTTLTFQSLLPSGWWGPTLDNVRVDFVSAADVPEPASAALVGGALLGLAGLRRKRRA